jgi:hypothetical protein
VNVNGAQTDELFQFLKSECPGIFGTKGVKWNFTKFLCGRDGVPYKRYGSTTSPSKIAKDIEKLLALSCTATTPVLAERCGDGSGDPTSASASAETDAGAEAQAPAAPER